ncbi:hypothetical protein [Marinobacter sp.]|uniref:hypothetical protein n=1 Tax=Marinobacter sp. TaxID=50741 RepID=UPI001A0CB4B2|nr:hypothetical protein [Marinobacter sp.]MBE0487359.1 hypothetical protein [Marinobacter sp.]
MRWIVFILIALNGALWYVPAWLEPPVSKKSEHGVLPRVSSLKVAAPAVSLERSSLACVRIGWFESRDEAERFGVQFAEDFVVQEVERELPPLNWVMIPPQSREAALAEFRVLYAGGVESYVVSEGEYRNAISLGLFESRSAAESVLEQKRQQNLNVVLVNFPRNRIGYALVLGVDPERETELVQAVESDNHGNFDFVEIYACEGVATPEKNP